MRLSRLIRSLALAISVVAAAGVSASAAVVVDQSGTLGSYSYTDTDMAPGARCIYNEPGGQGNDIDRILVRHPIVFAAAGERPVGWRFIVQRSRNVGGGGGWVTIHRSSFQKRDATANTPAAFTDRSYAIKTDADHHFRTLVAIRFYEPGSRTDVAGSVRLRTQFYRALNGASRVDLGKCLPEY